MMGEGWVGVTLPAAQSRHEEVSRQRRRRARSQLRQNMTEAEKRVWQILRLHRMRGCKFRRQVPIGR